MATVFLKVARYSLKERMVIDHNVIKIVIYKFATAPFKIKMTKGMMHAQFVFC